jgi:hypothetical protein
MAAEYCSGSFLYQKIMAESRHTAQTTDSGGKMAREVKIYITGARPSSSPLSSEVKPISAIVEENSNGC